MTTRPLSNGEKKKNKVLRWEGQPLQGMSLASSASPEPAALVSRQCVGEDCIGESLIDLIETLQKPINF